MSSKNFDAYSAYYDLLYQSKDYRREADFIDELIREHAPGARALLDLGCGTGIHDWLLAEKGYEVTGVDQSTSMLEIARKRASQYAGVTIAPRFSQGTLQKFGVDTRQDVVVSLFDVVSYLTTHADLRLALANIVSSLKPGGLFIFDCWYGPAVYTQRPSIRVKRLEDDLIRLTRIAEAEFLHDQNRINVNYDVFVTWKADNRTENFKEVHPMRCYFDDELVELFSQFRLSPVFSMEWFTRKSLSTNTWSGLFGFRLGTSA